MEVLWSLFVALPLAYVVYRVLAAVVHHLNKCRILMKLPGSVPRNWILGNLENLPGLGEEGLAFMIDKLKEFPRLHYVFIGPFPELVIVHPDVAKVVLKSSEPKSLTATGVYRFLLPWLGKGLLVSGGKHWARNRKLLTPAFHFDILKPYMKVNNQAAEILMAKIQSSFDKDEYFEVFNHISLCTFDIILQCAFSYSEDCQLKGHSDPYVKAVAELGASLPFRILRPWLYPDFVFAMTKTGRQFKKNCDFVHSFAEKIIQTRRKTLSEDGLDRSRKYLDFLDILLTATDSDCKGLTDLEIRQEVDTFMFEGHDTTASGISWTLYSLAKHPEHMKRCQEEIDSVVDAKETEDIEWDDLPKLKYLNQCLKESLRLHTPVPFVQRTATKEMVVDGFTISKGTNISLQLYLMLHNSNVWPDPMEFKPDRFSPENISKHDSHQFIPFSAGPRNCIGQQFALHEMKVIIARILKRFDLVLKPGHEVRHVIETVMRAETGIYMMGIPRM